MKQIVGLALIVFGMMAGASTASVNMRNEKAGKPADQRFYESLGGACCALFLAVPGFILALSGGEKKATGSTARHPDRIVSRRQTRGEAWFSQGRPNLPRESLGPTERSPPPVWRATRMFASRPRLASKWSIARSVDTRSG